MKKILTLLFITLFFVSCEKKDEAIIPDLTWDLFESPDAISLSGKTLLAMEGVYRVTNGSDVFGEQVAVKSSYVINNTDTTFHVSFLCGKDIAYFISSGKMLDSTILLNGYWRKMINSETGISRFTIDVSGVRKLLSQNPVLAQGDIIIEGNFGSDQNVPDQKITLTYDRPLHVRNGFQVLAHRAGGRTSDQLSVSENSVAMINKTQQFGSTGIEIDVRLTSDGVPILYHDNTINDRLIQPNGMAGAIENYSYTQLNNLTRLINGEKIPTLQEALNAVIYNTSLEFVWLDTKYVGNLEILKQIQSEYLQKAVAAGRTLEILIGLPGDDQLNAFMQLNDYTNTPSLCELTRENVRSVNAKVWAPRWTLGTQNSEVDGVHAEGRKAFTWTMDVPDYINTFITEGHFDGILSNYPSIVAYYEYVK